ncbi:DNA-binding protein YbaB [Kibdelosporangium banguiense]|uniref:DNA-binding protein YbaB n=1 Tax=Kibdelosporangium banguiense TaxID=1365924 RepID=A0ABS4T861_9PSEU|nr:YbaB/EbfC family nucleoid-associated protein [Kibdelosporangium banguiense]MBP2320602.1 DNA-binding protein YbaB [Kibdelosporangium banguiense]
MPGAEWEQQVEATAAGYRRMAERIEQILVTEASTDGAVRVTVSASGLLTDLQLADRELAAQVLACIRKAQARIPDLMRTAMVETVGTQDPNTHLVLAAAAERFPPLPSSAPPPPRADMVTGAEGDWDERAVLEDIGGPS